MRRLGRSRDALAQRASKIGLCRRFATPAAERFWRYVERGDGCWLWTGAQDRKGYGRFNLGDDRTGFAHRFAYELLVGPIPDGMAVMHLCDTPLCVNPDHLQPGTIDENNADKVSKGRQQRGSRHWRSTLTEDVAREIKQRLADGETQAALARRFAVDPETVRAVATGRTWKHVSV